MTTGEVLSSTPPLEPKDCHNEVREPSESYVQDSTPVEPQPVRRNLPTFEESYEVVGGCIVLLRE